MMTMTMMMMLSLASPLLDQLTIWLNEKSRSASETVGYLEEDDDDDDDNIINYDDDDFAVHRLIACLSLHLGCSSLIRLLLLFCC